MRVVHYSGDRIGGAARAAARLHAALKQTSGVDTEMLVVEKHSTDPTVTALGANRFGRVQTFIQAAMDALPRRLARQLDSMPRSTSCASRLTADEIDANPAELAHLHWINGGFLSIEQIGRVRKPLVWTLHDMWPFCGAEHLSLDTPSARWRTGYPASSEIPFLDVDRWTWRRKQRAWQRPIHMVAPSRWMAECVRNSALMRDFPVHVVPNTLDVTVFRPVHPALARQRLGLPAKVPLVLFGAIKGTQLPYKGWDLLLPALQRLAGLVPGVQAVVFGQARPDNPPALSLPVHWMGHVSEDERLVDLYNAVDVLMIPSRQESFGQTGSEAHACGCPVVAFNATGLRDVVDHEITGLLATPYDSTAFADAVASLLGRQDVRLAYGRAARARAERLWSHAAVALQHLAVYEAALRR